jgi:MipA family protein
MAITNALFGIRLLPLASLLVAVPFGLVAGGVLAQDMAGPGKEERRGKWEFVLGAGAIHGPTYEGAKEFDSQALPFFSISYGEKLSLGFEGLSYEFYQAGPLSLTGKLGFSFGRKQSDDPHLAGLGDIESGAALGFGMGYELGPLRLTADFERSFGDDDGIVGKIGAEYSHPVGRVLLGAGVSATWADDNHMQSFFGVTGAQSAASGLAQYDAGAGFKRADLELSATYMVAENWMLRGQIAMGQLLGDAADSPVVQDTTQTSAAVFVVFKF